MTALRVLLVGCGGVKKGCLCAAQLPTRWIHHLQKKQGRKMAYIFFFEPLEFGTEINRCSGMGAEECLSLSSCLLSREDLQRVSIKELTLVMT